MTEAEYQELLVDIRDNGLREPILCTPDQVLLDGRHRLKACLELEVVPRFTEWEGEMDEPTIAALVFSLNLHRRHLTDGQKAMLGAYLEERYGAQIPKGRPGESVQIIAQLTGKARDHAANAIGVNRQYISDAKRIRQSAPDLVRPLTDGEITIPEARKLEKMEEPARFEVGRLVTQEKMPVKEAIRKVKRDSIQPTTSMGEGRVIIADSIEWMSNHRGEFDCLVADPPYNTGRMEWDTFSSNEDYLDFTAAWLHLALVCLKEQYHSFVFCPSEYAMDYEDILRGFGRRPQSRIIWHHRNLSMGRVVGNGLARTYDVIFHCGTRALNLPDEWDDKRFDVQTFAAPQTNFDDQKLHQAQKPLELIKWLVEIGSKPGEQVLDPFAGSGTTGIACLELGREATLVEQNEEYARIAEGRIAEWVTSRKTDGDSKN
jgi:DNA modification methylase/ParB-like chromosome segregation protein Spo0J